MIMTELSTRPEAEMVCLYEYILHQESALQDHF